MGRHAIARRERVPGSRVRSVLAAALAAAFVLTVAGLVLLWPRGAAPEPVAGFRESQSMAAEAYAGEVTAVFDSACGSPAVGAMGLALAVPATTIIATLTASGAGAGRG